MVKESSINRCWEEAMKLFLEKAYSRNLCGREYMLFDDLTVYASEYLCETSLSKFCPWLPQSREYYLSQLDVPGKYSEINRLYSYGYNQFDQYHYAIKVLRKRKNIKPIVISIYDPLKDNRENIPTPCINNIVLDTWDNTVNMYVSYSTINLFRMGLLDFHLMAYLHQKIAQDVGYRVGNLKFHSVQAHMPVFEYYIGMKLFDIGE